MNALALMVSDDLTEVRSQEQVDDELQALAENLSLDAVAQLDAADFDERHLGVFAYS